MFRILGGCEGGKAKEDEEEDDLALSSIPIAIAPPEIDESPNVFLPLGPLSPTASKDSISLLKLDAAAAPTINACSFFIVPALILILAVLKVAA